MTRDYRIEHVMLYANLPNTFQLIVFGNKLAAASESETQRLQAHIPISAVARRPAAVDNFLLAALYRRPVAETSAQN